MGTDIHIIVEEEQPDKTWKVIDADYQVGGFRDYDVFALLANVRTDENLAFVPPRGVPADASDRVKKIHPQKGYHSYSYYELEELISFLEKAEAKVWAYYPGGGGMQIANPADCPQNEGGFSFCRVVSGCPESVFWIDKNVGKTFAEWIKPLRSKGKKRRLIMYFDS